MALSPEVEKCGLVLPSLKRPHSGWSLLAHPFGDLASAARSFQPICASGQPKAWAIGSGMAITSGVCTNEGRSVGIGLGRSRSVESWSTSTAHELDAGLHTSGRGPSTSSSHPRASAVAAAPLDFVATAIHMHVPSTSGADGVVLVGELAEQRGLLAGGDHGDRRAVLGCRHGPGAGIGAGLLVTAGAPEPLADRDHEDDAHQRRDDQWDD